MARLMKARWRRHLPLYLLVAITTLPIAAAYIAYYVAPPSGRTNYGTLIEPQRPTPALPMTKLDGTAFDLRELNWVSVPDHSSTALFEAPIARPNVAVVIIATRWICHDYQNVREFCVKHGKHFVKLPAGYHPNQIAAAILSQVGQKLHAAE